MKTSMDAWITCQWERQADGRYYVATLHQDLWGTWIVSRTWGGRIVRSGHARCGPVPDRDAGIRELQKIIKRRAAHGYRQVQIGLDSANAGNLIPVVGWNSGPNRSNSAP